ncbi:MAG TPA: methyltransferase [Chlamydiales bacterium]|nr:methyltransferase [Chlamydiales bacterium]
MNNPSTCPHFSLCSGCTHATLDPPIWQEALTLFAPLKPTLHTLGFSQTRYKAKLAIRPGPQIGLFKRNTHDVIPIPHCLVHHPAINRAAHLLQQAMTLHNLSAYSEATATGTLRYAQFFVDRATSLVQLTLIINDTHNLQPLLDTLSTHDLWHSIWLNHQPKSTNTILGSTFQLIQGEPFLWQTLNSTPVPFHPGAFSQTHLPLFELMLRQIESWTPPNTRILELYAGVGAIGLTLASKAKEITLVENNPFAHLSYNQAAKPNITYYPTDAKEAPLTTYDLIIVDPPRKGLDPELLPRLSAPQLIYISCSFESFKRDYHQLLAHGWRLKDAAGYLLFPGTNHVETLALFEKCVSGIVIVI